MANILTEETLTDLCKPTRNTWSAGEIAGFYYCPSPSSPEVRLDVSYGVKIVPNEAQPTVDITVIGSHQPSGGYKPLPPEHQESIEKVIRAIRPQKIRQVGFLSPIGPWKVCYV